MGAVRIIVLAVAALAAIGLALLVHKMTSHRAPPPVPVAVAAPQKPTVQVLVARRDLPVGTRLAPNDMAWQSWPADSMNPAFITDGAAPVVPASTVAGKAAAGAASVAKTAASALSISNGGAMQALTGAIVREPLLAGEPMVERKIVRGGQGGYMAVMLQPGMRAVAIEVNVNSAAGGFVLPGDRVDVVMSRKIDNHANGSSGSEETASAATVLGNLRVLAIDQQIQPAAAAKTLVGATATLEVPAADVEALLRAKAEGDLSLALRSYADTAGPAGRIGQLAQSQSIRVVRAGKVTEVMTR